MQRHTMPKTVRHLPRADTYNVRNTQWKGCSGMQLFEFVHATVSHRIEMPTAFVKNCSNCAAAL